MSGKTRTHLGISLLDWRAHLKGLAVRWIMHYLDSKRGAWKMVLDMWFERTVYGRGAVLTTIPAGDLTQSITHRPSALPRFWKFAVTSVRKLALAPLALTREGANTQPVLDNPTFKVNLNIILRYFRDRGGVITFRDIYKADGTEYSRAEILDECQCKCQGKCECQKLLKDGEGNFILSSKTHIAPERMWQEWCDMLQQLPKLLVHTARGLPPSFPPAPIRRARVIRDSWDDFITPTATRDGVGEHILRKGGFGVTPFGPHPHNRTRFEGWKGGPLAEGEFTIQPPDWGEFKEKRRFESRDPPTRKRGQDIVFVPEGHKLTPPIERVVKKRAHPEVVCILDDATARKDSHESAGHIKIRYGVPSNQGAVGSEAAFGWLN